MNAQPPIDPTEQKALYSVLNSVNSEISWTTLFPGDLCRIPPPGVVCHYFIFSSKDSEPTSHVVELNIGNYVSDDGKPTLPCSHNATFNPSLFTPFNYLRKLTFHKCFNNTQQHLISLPSSLHELVFIDNPSIVSPLLPLIHNLNSLKRLVLVGNGFHGELPPNIGDFKNLEELTLARNNLSGEIPASLGSLKKLKILDLSHNHFKGCVPKQLGFLRGRITFSARVGQKLKLAGNIGLCLGKNDH
jgi:hypothetical protein